MGRSDPLCFETNLQRSTMENADALMNDTVTTTTTVEVFRTALDAEKPERLVTLPPPPVPSIDDRPQLVRLNGPDHETWTSRRTETLINDRPIQTAHQGKAVQWKGTLVDEKKGAQKITAYNPYSGLRSPYENAITSRQPLVIRRQFQPGNVDPSDEGLLSRHNSYESAYLVHSPSEFPVVSHPVITRSQENLSRSPYQADLKMAKESALLTDSHDLACHPAIPDTSVNYVNRLETPILNKATSSGYEQVRRTVSAYNPGRYLDSGSLKHCSSEAHGILPDQTTAHPIRHQSRRPRSSSRGRRHRDNRLQRNCDNEQQKHCVGNANRSESPFHQKSVECATTNCYTTAPFDSLFLAYSKRTDPNLLPGEVPLRAKSQEIFNLYQTRDIMQNVVAQFGELGYDYLDDAIPSPSTESEYSVISELSTRADRTRSDTLEEFLEDGNSVEEAYLRPLHRNNYSIMSENLYEELEHIYEELDNYYSKNLQTPERTTSASTLREIDSSEESDYAIIDFQETTRDNSDQMYKNDKSEYNDVVQRLRQEVRPYSIRKSRRIRKAHPDGLVFPKITAIVSTLPEVPEEFELLPQAPEGGGISLSSLPYVDESPQIPDNKPLPTVLMLPKEES
ncbi:hypothetical protein DICVIV_03964 [Dictyocaulus viviparus]|uniref:Uncharacterized protein n=1 Tax=Dictyocaulus viviparus TaxID=29172 RepID=A0A0D8Y1L0_DICVI|nr:hypothetical protein DICVIV_03964 [Dictyocaulus viviparus]